MSLLFVGGRVAELPPRIRITIRCVCIILIKIVSTPADVSCPITRLARAHELSRRSTSDMCILIIIMVWSWSAVNVRTKQIFECTNESNTTINQMPPTKNTWCGSISAIGEFRNRILFLSTYHCVTEKIVGSFANVGSERAAFSLGVLCHCDMLSTSMIMWIVVLMYFRTYSNRSSENHAGVHISQYSHFALQYDCQGR